MLLSFLSVVLVGLSVDVAAIPGARSQLYRRADNDTVEPYSLPESDDEPAVRAQAIEIKRQTFLYGPSPVGGGPFFPTGSLGNATVYRDVVQDGQVLLAVGQKVAADEAAAFAAIEQAGGINSLADYNILYNGQWKNSVPEGVDLGMLSNYTQDILFSMERLSVNPFSIKRLRPEDRLPFVVDDETATNLTGATLERLHEKGFLFYADHRAQANLPRTARYAAACDAYFYIDPISGDFLPLAIRPNAGSDLIYTPLDEVNDWLLAKIMFNINDFWYTDWYHFAGTHEVVEIVYEAAIRTLSDDHPILAILNRIGYRAFAYRIDAATRLINTGGPIDTLFPFPGTSAAQFTEELYSSGVGAFQSNYFQTNLASRGLIDCTYGPALKYFPFYDDASVIHSHLTSFFTTFVQSYYPTEDLLLNDNELQAWIAEANGPAQVIDFPPAPLTDPATVIAILTHFAYLVTTVHHTLNTNDLSESLATLPFHPVSLYSPIPTSKGVRSVLPWLPGPEAAIGQIGLSALFNRQLFAHSNQTLKYLFEDEAVLKRMNNETVKAAKDFYHEMGKFSRKVSERKFDREGLSQGMPFLWRALDPEVALFYLAI